MLVSRPVWTNLVGLLSLLLSLALVAPPARAASPPDPPVITSPEASNVAPEDVHMEMGAPFRDPDGDGHQATDWEIRTADGATVVWAAYNSPVLTHAHFSDGTFQGPLAGRRRLEYTMRYLFRARYQDSSGAWSAWAERPFVTMRLDRMLAMQVRGFLSTPAPRWETEGQTPIALPPGARLVLETTATPLLTLAPGAEGLTAAVETIVPTAADLRLRLVAPPDAGLRLADSRLTVVTIHAEATTLFLPALALAPGQEQLLWVSSAGATFYGDPGHPRFNRERLARDIALPWQLPPGYDLEAVTAATQLPVSLAFVPNRRPEPSAPHFYVTELHGRIKVVTNDGRVSNFAEDLLNFGTTPDFPGAGEIGVIGICLPPTGSEVYATMVVRDAQGIFRVKVTRLRTDDGLTATGAEDILLSGSDQGRVRASHQIQQCAFGPDGKLYTFVADGTGPRQAASDATFNGKVLRLNADGSAPPDNPRYDPANPRAPISYQYTKGQRNAFGLAFRPSDGQLYLTENGPNVDRLVRAVPGLDYGWDGSDESMRKHALYVWPEAHWSPVGLTFVEGPAAGALPADVRGKLLVASASPVYTLGPQRTGKAIQAFTLDPDGGITRPPTLFARYIGEGRGSIVDLKLQPDGLYFTDLYLDDGDGGPTAAGGKVWRIRYTGEVRFDASTLTGPAPLHVDLADRSTLIGAHAPIWDFGDGEVAAGPTASHTFATPGRYAVSLRVTGADGQRRERLTLITVTDPAGQVPDPAPTPRPLTPAPTPSMLFFPETGVGLGGGFRIYWERHGGLTQFGYPLTGEFDERNPADGQVYTVQYFERARFEYHPEKAGTPYETELGLLGSQATAGRAGEAPFRRVEGVTADAERLVLDETGHTLSGIFRQRWEATGGVTIYGLPISEPFMEEVFPGGDAYLVQYFQRARMQHRPSDAGAVEEVRLRRLGTELYVRAPAPRAPR